MITAEDLIGRQLQPGDVDLCWAGDLTSVRIWEGWADLATVIDLVSRRVVGGAMADHLRTDLVCGALRMAIKPRRPVPGLIFPPMGQPVHLGAAHPAAGPARHPAEPVAAVAMLGPRGGGVVRLDPEGGADPPPRLADACTGAAGGVRVRGGVLQPAAAPLHARLRDARRLRDLSGVSAPRRGSVEKIMKLSIVAG